METHNTDRANANQQTLFLKNFTALFYYEEALGFIRMFDRLLKVIIINTECFHRNSQHK